MIISKTPLRISFVGGGTDIGNYYKSNGGCVISTAIDKYIYITINKRFDDTIRASYSKTETVDDVNKINHDITFYHQAYKTDIYASNNSTYQYTLNRNIGLNYLFFLPFSRFDRLEGGLSYNHIIKEESEINTLSGNESTLEYDSFNIFKPHLKYVWDNTRWFYLYPVSGTRSYLKYELVPQSTLNDYIFETITFDHRTYFELSFKNKISFASRLFLGSSWGKDQRLFGVGGGPWIFSDTNNMVNSDYEDALPFDDFYFMNNFVFPVRGFPMAEKLKVMLSTVDFTNKFLLRADLLNEVLNVSLSSMA